MTELSKRFAPAEVERRWYEHWETQGYFRARPDSGKPPYTIVIPPPNVTGSLHMGHALTVTIEDLLIRWKRMQGFDALWVPGTDHAGIATQMVVERDIRRTEGKSRHDLGREAFIARVWQWKERYHKRITEQLRVLGCSVDWSRERFTLDEGLSHAVREVFVRLYEEGLIYRAYRLINWCPKDHTALSDLEVEHEDVRGHLWHLRYPVEGDPKRHLTVATTRPETMLGDTAVAVHPEDPRYSDLIGKRVVLPLLGRAIPVIGDPVLVDREFGTGAVKVTPAHDPNDFETGKRHGLPEITIFDESARINENGGPYKGLDRFEARKRVLADLDKLGLLGEIKDHAHALGHCQRCGEVVEPRLSMQWFVRAEPLAKPALEAVKSGATKILPETWEKTYYNWMETIRDWCISRQLWWGHRIPAWYCGDCQHITVARTDPTQCAGCKGKNLRRDDDVLDTWFSSALWPFSTLGWPEQTVELARYYPNAVMETGFDILFFWVARMMMMGCKFMGRAPFPVIYLHPMVRDEKGEKMSKTRGNVIDPLDLVHGITLPDLKKKMADMGVNDEILRGLDEKYPEGIEEYGTDALRFTLAALTGTGRDLKLSLERVAGYRAFANKIWNAARFALMNLADYAPGTQGKGGNLYDRWITSRLNAVVEQTNAHLENYRFDEAANALYAFFWNEFCDWYIELAKPMFYGEKNAARTATQANLVHVLDQALRLLHPFMPFLTEEIWQKLPLANDRPASLMLAQYPSAGPRDAQAEQTVSLLMEAVGALRNVRSESNIPPGKKVAAELHVALPEHRQALAEQSAMICTLAALERVEIVAPRAKPPASATTVSERLEAVIPLLGIIDVAAESTRLKKEIAKVEGDLKKTQSKLGNEKFIAGAPADVVEKERGKEREMNDVLARLRSNLSRLTSP